MTPSRKPDLAVGFDKRGAAAVWFDDVPPGEVDRVSQALIAIWCAAPRPDLPHVDTSERPGRDALRAMHPDVEVSPVALELPHVAVESWNVQSRHGMRRLDVTAASTAAAAAVFRSWDEGVRSDRLGHALVLARQPRLNSYGTAHDVWNDVSNFGAPVGDLTDPVSYFRLSRSKPMYEATASNKALVEAEAAGSELLFVACVEAFLDLGGQEQTVFDAMYGVQVARAIATEADRFQDDQAFLGRLALTAGHGTRWRDAERLSGAKEPLGTARITKMLSKTISEYGGEDLPVLDSSHFGDIALRAYFDGIPVGAGSRGVLLPGDTFLTAGFRYATDLDGDHRLTRPERVFLRKAFSAGAVYADLRHYVELQSPTTPPVVDEFKACPDCAEEVRLAARKCRHCGYLFE